MNIFEIYTKQEIEKQIAKINELIETKLSDKDILEKLNIKCKEELLDIAKARRRALESKSKFINAKFFNNEDLRFSTPQNVADYRAEKLKCAKIVDLCSGIGIQANAFAFECEEVLGIEIDKRKVEYAKNNFSRKNLMFVCGDVLGKRIINKIKEFKPDIIFCDPERLESEKERTLESIKPNIRKLIELYSKITDNICIEIPPQISMEKLRELGEFEAKYISFNNKLNRLDICFGNLKNAKISVEDVSGERLEKSNVKAEKTKFPGIFLYEASTAVLKAGLEKELAKLLNAKLLWIDNKKLLLTSEKLVHSSFAKNYRVLGYSSEFDEIIEVLNENNINKVILKKNVSDKDYWNERRKYESELKRGNREACLFSVGNIEIVAVEL